MLHPDDITKTPDELFRNYYDWACRKSRALRARYPNRDASIGIDDVTQECLMALNDAAKSWDRHTQPFCSYASTCLFNRYCSKFGPKRKKRVKQGNYDPETIAHRCNAQDIVDGQEYLDRLDPMKRRLIRMVLGGLLKSHETAELMHVSQRTVERWTKQLKDELCRQTA